MKFFLTIWMLFLLFCSAFSATQVPDICIIKNDSTHIDTLITFSYPLEDYFEKIGTRDLPGFKSCESNACTRGYQAVWLVENDSLFLLNIQGCNEYMSWCDEASLPNLHLMFGRQSKNNRVYADWVNGKYIFFEGDEIPYLKKQLFNAERILSFKNGKLKRTKRYLNVKPRKKSFGVEENTPEFLLSFIQQNINWKAIPKKDPAKWITDIEVLIKKNGYTQLSIKTTGSKSFKAAVEKELSRCLKNFRWFQYRQSGSRIEVSFVVKAQFDNEKQIITIIK